ncbi:MAG TPA: bifunctional (p)ppGpp synthetase/guanosine-3',5'-bis(diphosphate) 3'-pyrophosphohydrolase [Vicinamibacterales bacterium]|nr:bifunctional (p)ppGpp synthetase/guanosine-3',5'-bis(diphosphate) 3'-pyrophosphohydrolase [Vicinamibacterales bacterium]HPW19704.1 bifunctional (p)ppGpp synthetase/guanosine-3',5'-bis(diphosphate) 3'-pyrophosphohydrolase [Vicinamibacterales bacterium]
MIRFEDLVARAQTYMPEADIELLRRAYVFSAMAHQGQVRQSGQPYLVHPLEVAHLLADMKLDPAAIIAGLLHDVVEDTLTTVERIEELFGREVAHLVEGVTKISVIPFSSSEERQAENFRKILLAMVDDIRVVLVKLADRLHNMRTLGAMPEERRQRTARETLDIYAPIANRLGMSRLKNELEDLAFRHLEPEAYEALKARVERRRKATEGLLDEMRRSMAATLKEAQIPVIEIDGRSKRLYSIHQKLRRQQIDLEQVYDFLAIRVITDTIKDCYAALGIVHHSWPPVPGRIKDFIATPRPNGYQSLHTSVMTTKGVAVEVQIRTQEMHRLAEEGIASHWKYKEGRVGAANDERYFQWLRQTLEWQQEVRDPQEFIQNLKVDLYPDEVYTFTPKGQVKSLPRDSTVIDFAYSIHSDVGHQCVGARINGKMMPLRTRLRNGDVVEIVTSAKHRPSRDWLNFVVTTRARNRIRAFLHAEEKARAIEIGRKLLEKAGRRFAVNLKALLEGPGLDPIAPEWGVPNGLDLLAAVGYGRVGARQVLARASPDGELKEKRESAVRSAVKKVIGLGSGDSIRVSGADDVLVVRARCCNPIHGERIVGYITRGKGVSVHAASCPNVTSLLYDPERRIDVEWTKSAQPGQYTVRLGIQVQDRKGMVAAVSAAIASVNTNIVDIEARTDDEQRGWIRVTIEISDMKHLEKVMKSLRGIPGVVAVERARAVPLDLSRAPQGPATGTR